MVETQQEEPCHKISTKLLFSVCDMQLFISLTMSVPTSDDILGHIIDFPRHKTNQLYRPIERRVMNKSDLSRVLK